MRDIAVAVALYNNEKEVIKFVENLLKQTLINRIQLLVTCNACNNVGEFEKKIHEILPSARVFDPKENLGYLNGCLYGVRVTGNVYSWVLVSNTDIDFKQNDFFEKSIENVPKDVWCIGPDITLAATGTHQNPFLLNRPSKKRVLIWKIAYSNYLLFRLYFKLSELKPKKKQDGDLDSRYVYAVHGSCFLLEQECVRKIIKNNPKIFMYGEELLVAETVYNNGKKVYFTSNVGIIHNENQVTGKIGMKRKQKWFKESIDYIFM